MSIESQDHVWGAFEVRAKPALTSLRASIEALTLNECG